MRSHQHYMQQVLALAAKGRLTVSPNPMVACVIVQHDEIVAQAWHQKAGEPHAEILALAAAGDRARGATVYVNLEPCSHFGRTPPCVDALIDAEVARVVIANQDPNPQVNGQGISRLKAAGIEVIVEILEAEGRQLNEIFFHFMQQQQPYVIAKWAMTLDGKISHQVNQSAAITGQLAQQHAHQYRQTVDAILVGRNTVAVDDPALTVRLADQKDVKHPLRIVLDSCGKLLLNHQIFQSTLPGKTLVATTQQSSVAWREQLLQQGVECLVLAENNKRVCIKALLTALAERGLTSLLVEGGGEVLASFFEKQWVNKVHVYMAARLFGGSTAPMPIAGQGVSNLTAATQLEWQAPQCLGDDLLIEARVKHV